MEVKRKRLHAHAAPVVLMATGLFLATFLIFTTNNPNATQLSHALITPVVKVKPTSNGLAHISLNQTQSRKKNYLDSNVITQAGKNINLSLTIQAFANE